MLLYIENTNMNSKVWDGLTDSRITFSISDIPESMRGPESEMARLTENLNLQRGLLRRLETRRDVTLIDNTRVDTIYQEEREGGGWPVVRLVNGQQFRARLLVSNAYIMHKPFYE